MRRDPKAGRPWTAFIFCTDVQDRRTRHVCRNCEADLPTLTGPDKRKVQCDERCRIAWETEHFWSLASAAKLKAVRVVLDAPDLVTNSRINWRCERCGELTEAPEVNHIEPVRGGYRFATCLNHSDNLEVLCHRCHVKTTAIQFGYRDKITRVADKITRVAGPSVPQGALTL